jgi:hypothetical protein
MAVALKSPGYEKPTVEMGRKWLDRIRDAEGREDKWRKQAARAEAIYLNRTENGAHKFYFNILHSNIETIVPAIYSQTPKPDIRRRFGDPDAIVKDAAQMLERAILVQIDDGTLDPEMEALAWSAFTVGRGVIRIRLVEEDALSGSITDDTQDVVEDAAKHDGEETTEGPSEDYTPEMPPGPSVQRIAFEAVPWDDFRFGPGRRWEDVPWIAFRHTIPEEQIKAWAEDEGVQAQVKSVSSGALDDQEADAAGVPVWEIWCRQSKSVKFIRARDGVVYKIVDDPLGLTGFFPCIRPIQPIEKVGDLAPVAPFELYADLAEELDKTTRRIQKLIEGVKVRGGAAAGELLKGIADIAGLEDNEIAEIRGVEAFAQQGGLEKGITWWPIEKSIEAIQVLAAHRDQVKATIYEVTGISDIIRGASNATETATAQQIKSQWGSLRIQKMQRLIERGVREIFVMCAELIATRFTPETLQAITALDYTPEVDAIFKNRVARFYRIDVETDSTIKADMSKSKQDMTEFLAGTAQYIQAVGPAVQAGMMPGPLAVEIYASFARTFRLGKQADDALAQMAEQAKQPQEPQIPPEVQQQIEQGMQMIQQLQGELSKVQQENVALKADQSTKMAELDANLKIEDRKIALDAQKIEIEAFKAQTDRLQATMQPPAAEPAPAPEPETKPATLTAADLIPVIAQAVAVVREVVPQPKAVAPRMKRTPVRDENGMIVHTIDEPIEETEP